MECHGAISVEANLRDWVAKLAAINGQHVAGKTGVVLARSHHLGWIARADILDKDIVLLHIALHLFPCITVKWGRRKCEVFPSQNSLDLVIVLLHLLELYGCVCTCVWASR